MPRVRQLTLQFEHDVERNTTNNKEEYKKSGKNCLKLSQKHRQLKLIRFIMDLPIKTKEKEVGNTSGASNIAKTVDTMTPSLDISLPLKVSKNLYLYEFTQHKKFFNLSTT